MIKALPIRGNVYLPIICSLALSIFVACVVCYIYQPIVEAHGFRQTQTAMTAYWLAENGFMPAYETPVGGAPWSIPFEFPIFQAIVALISVATAIHINVIGRLASAIFLLSCLWPASRIAKQLNLDPDLIWIFCTLLLTSPLYLLWGRSSMIETAALFFSLAAIPFAIDLLTTKTKWSTAALCGTFLTLALLQKITTAATVWLVFFVMWLLHFWSQKPQRSDLLSSCSIALTAFLIPMGIAYSWVVHSDYIKSLNHLGAYMTSSKLRSWNFGGLLQHPLPELLRTVVWKRCLLQNGGGIFGLALIAYALLQRNYQKARLAVFISVLLFLLPILIFANLHLIHTYYQASCTVFLIAAISISIATGIPKLTRWPFAIPLVSTIFVSWNLWGFYKNVWPVISGPLPTEATRTLALAQILRDRTPTDSAFIAYGYDWDSSLAYYAQRKSFTVPTFFDDYEQTWANPEKFLGDLPLAAFVICPNARGPNQSAISQKLADDSSFTRIKVDDCDILLRTFP